MLREMFAESLVDRGTVLLWVAQQVGTSTIPQLGFVVKLAEEYLEGLLEHRGFLRPFITGITDKLLEVRFPLRSALVTETFLDCPDSTSRTECCCPVESHAREFAAGISLLSRMTWA